jgi:KAP family P-loop domain
MIAHGHQFKRTKIMNELPPLIFAIDSPITGDATSPDRLGRQTLAKTAVEILLKDNSGIGFAMSVEGAWGSGKTSFCNLMKRELSVNNKETVPIVIDFNPWMFGTREQLTKAFLKCLAAKLSLPDTEHTLKKWLKRVKWISRIAKLAGIIPGMGVMSESIGEVKTAMDEYANALEQMSASNSFELERQKSKVSNALLKLKLPIIVFVDDIDRLVPEEIFEMIRLIKAVGDLPYLRYVVPYDAEYVVSALGRYDIHNADGYLEKIFQFRFPLPPCDKESLRAMLVERLDQLPESYRTSAGESTSELYSETYYSGMRDLIETPRDIARAFASIEIKAARSVGELLLPEIIALEFIAIKAPNVHRQILRQPSLWTGSSNLTAYVPDLAKDKKQEDTKLRNEAFANLSSAISVAVTHLTQAIFPHTLPDKSYKLYRGNKLRLALPDRLRFYANVGLPSGEVSKADATLVLSTPEKFSEIAEDHFANQRHRRFFSIMLEEIETRKVTEPKLLLAALGALLSDKQLFTRWNERPDFFERSARQDASSLVTHILYNDTAHDPRYLIRSALEGEFGFEVSRFAAARLEAVREEKKHSPDQPQDPAWGTPEEINHQLKIWVEFWCPKLPELIKEGRVMIGGLTLMANLADESSLKMFMSNFEGSEDLDSLILIISYGGQLSGRDFAFAPIELLEKLSGESWWRNKAKERLDSGTILGTLKHSYKAIYENKKILLETGEEC